MAVAIALLIGCGSKRQSSRSDYESKVDYTRLIQISDSLGRRVIEQFDFRIDSPKIEVAIDSSGRTRRVVFTATRLKGSDSVASETKTGRKAAVAEKHAEHKHGKEETKKQSYPALLIMAVMTTGMLILMILWRKRD